ncbi:MAG TPA: DUF2892 domain-containing protein [Aquifex aeolicus]|nr:DUF2892 domain-containing protein [Aquifex aeolicus]
MEKNMILWNRIIRVILAIIFLYLAITNDRIYWILDIVGIIFLITSTIGFCPLYKVAGFRTG